MARATWQSAGRRGEGLFLHDEGKAADNVAGDLKLQTAGRKQSSLANWFELRYPCRWLSR